MGKNLMNFTKIRSPRKLTTIPYSINTYTAINTNIPYSWSVFLAASWLTNEYISSYALIRICYQGPHSNAYNSAVMI